MSPARHYTIGDRLLRSTIPLPELSEAKDGQAEIQFEVSDESGQNLTRATWFGCWPNGTEDDGWWVRFAHLEGRFLLRFAEQADFVLSTDGASIRCVPCPGVPPVTIRHLLLDQVLPLAMSLGGDLVLHGSGVEIGGHGVGFVGPTGTGKSTLAAAFAESGHLLLTDDCVVLREHAGCWRVLPDHPGVRLWPDNTAWLRRAVPGDAEVAHYTTKQRVGAREWRLAVGAPPLKGLFMLRSGDDRRDGSARARRIPAARAIIVLLDAQFLLPIRSAAVLRRQFEQLSGLSAQVPCYALSFQRDHGSLATVFEAVSRTMTDPLMGESDPC